MRYSNDKINKMISERDSMIEKYNREIQNEIDKEKSKYKFSWKRFLLMIGSVILIIAAIQINEKIFAKTSIWSWQYYGHK